MKTSQTIDYDYIQDREIDDVGRIKKVYRNVVQELMRLAPTKNTVAEAGRGTGKTTVMFAERLVDVSWALRGSVIVLSAPTYAFILDTLLQGLSIYLLANYVRGIHYEIGRRPPKHFIEPDADPGRWEHTISFVWGTVIQFVSADRPESSVGKNATHLFCDETLRLREDHFRERIMPALRSDKTKYGASQFYGGITLTSSTPNLENDHDWWLQYRDLVNDGNMKDVRYVSYRISKAAGTKVKLLVELEKLKDKGIIQGSEVDKLNKKVEQNDKFVRNWTAKLTEKLLEKEYWWNYIHASSFSNLAVLGIDYMQQQLTASGSNFDKFKLSILGIRPSAVKNKFFARFNANRHIYTDSYLYKFTDGFRSGDIDTFSIGDGYQITSRDLLHCNPDAPLFAGYDPGDFQSIVFAQEKNYAGEKELRFLKNFWAYLPEEHHELALKIEKFFKNHNKKVIYLHYDRAGNKRLEKYRNNTKGNTDARILKSELEDLGWTVHLESLKQRTIFHWEHFLLFSRLYTEREKNLPRLRYCQNETDELISSIQMTPRKPSDSDTIEMDKRAEKTLAPEDQVRYSPQIATAHMYLVWGLYNELKPEAEPENINISGL